MFNYVLLLNYFFSVIMLIFTVYVCTLLGPLFYTAARADRLDTTGRSHLADLDYRGFHEKGSLGYMCALGIER